jgi:Phage integrase family
LCNRPDFAAKLERRGWERALVYKALVLTGLRKGELASLTVGNTDIDGGLPYVVLDAANEKAGRGADIPVRADLAADLRAWLAEQLETARNFAAQSGRPIPARLAPETPLFTVPTGLNRILDRDLVAAGIAKLVVGEDGKLHIDKSDDRGRTIDVHALRHTFGTHLSKGGVAPRTAQAAMRHGSLEMTMQTYTDPKLLDVAGALDVLPSLPLGDDDGTESQRATGTFDVPQSASRTLVPGLVQNTGNRGPKLAFAGKTGEGKKEGSPIATSCDDKPCDSVTRPVTKRASGFEPPTSSLGSTTSSMAETDRSSLISACYRETQISQVDAFRRVLTCCDAVQP